MSHKHIMRGDSLAAFLQVHYSALHYWQTQGILTVDERAEPVTTPIGHPLYHYSSIETFLQAYPNCPGASAALSPLAELLVLQQVLEQPGLLTCKQAAAWLEIPESAVKTALKDSLISIRLGPGGSIRIPLDRLIDYGEARAGEGAVSAKFAMKILGVGIKKISTLSASVTGPLERQHVPGSHGELYIVTDSLMALITECLATGTAQEWWRLRMRNSFEPLLTLETIRTTHAVHERTIRSLIDDGTLPCLYIPGTTRKITRIPQHAVELWAWRRNCLSDAWLSFLFGTTAEQIAVWIDRKQLCRLRHGRRMRADVCPSLNCISEYIASNQTTAFDPEEWIRQCLRERQYPVAIEELSLGSGVTAMPRGLRLPDGSIVVMQADVAAYQAQQRRAARSQFLS